MKLLDSRRLTGANLYWDHPSAIIEIDLGGASAAPVLEAWSAAARSLLSATGHGGQFLTHRQWRDGIALLISAPIDALYSMCELNEIAWQCALASRGHSQGPDLDLEQRRLLELFACEANPALLAMQQAAQSHDVVFLWDDDEVSVGTGQTCVTWPYGKVPPPEDVDWESLESIPVAMVTGTNGKSTTVRMAASIMAAADYSAGVTSTDFIRVGETIIERGDYSGTGGARKLLRHHDTGMAVLEVARGGLLRRGLGVPEVDVAVITNVAADHLGEYGINTVPDLIEAKFIVRRALGERGTLILNADDPGVVAFAENLDESLKRRIHWFSTVADHSRVIERVLEGGAATVFQDGWLVALAAQNREKIVPVSEIPAALAGAARHNVANALAAMALCREMGISGEAIRQGLAEFRGDASDNPGRGNWFEHNGVRILVDFAHNEHGMSALADMVCALPSERLVLAMGQAGDRLDDSIAACMQNESRSVDVMRSARIRTGPKCGGSHHCYPWSRYSCRSG
jgi:UDP-N-acetylmuramyl pentapeptide synthase